MEEESFTKKDKKLFELIWLPALGFLVGLSEFIITSVYQFYFFGFSLSMIMTVASGVLCCLKYKDYKIWLKTQDTPIDHANKSTAMILNAQLR